MTTFGANPLFESERFELIDLIQLLDPKGYRGGTMAGLEMSSTHRYSKPISSIFDTDAYAHDRAELEAALVAFYSPLYNEMMDQDLRVGRVQDRLIAASEQRCGAYKIYLKRFEVYNDTTLGIGSLVAGGVGAVVKSSGIAQRWAALSGILGGARAEIRQGFFANLASYVIIPGIDAKRKEIHNEMMSKRNDGGGLKNYSVEAAIADAARFHAACTLENGLEHAKDSISLVENPGQRMFLKSMNSAYIMRQAVNAYGSLEAGKPPTTAPKLVAMDFSAVDSGINGTPTANGSAAYIAAKAAAASDPNAIQVLLNSIQKYYDAFDGKVDAAVKSADTKKCGDDLTQTVGHEEIESRARGIKGSAKPIVWSEANSKLLTEMFAFEGAIRACAAVLGKDAGSAEANVLNQAKANLEGEVDVFLSTLRARFEVAEKKINSSITKIESCSKDAPKSFTHEANLATIRPMSIDEVKITLPTPHQLFAKTSQKTACAGIYKSPVAAQSATAPGR
jgi:hypothetical protein